MIKFNMFNGLAGWTSRKAAPGGATLFLTLALLAFCCDAGGALASPPPKIVSFGPDLITVLITPPVRDTRTGVLEGVELQSEVTSETVAAANGWRSMRAVLDVSCPDRRDRVRSMTVFSDHNGKGEAKAITPSADWTAPGQNTDYGLVMVNYFCSGGGRRAVAPAMAKPSSAPSSPAPAQLARSAPSPPPPVHDPVSEVAAPALAQPAMEDEATTNGMSSIQEPTSSPKPKMQRAPKTIVAEAKAPALGPFAIQVGSTITEADAKAMLGRLKTAHIERLSGLQSRIEAADVRGQRHYRALIVGLPDAESASRFCKTLQLANGCIVRRTPSADR